MEWKHTNFSITKYLKKLGTLGERGAKGAYEGHWQGAHLQKKLYPNEQVRNPTVVKLTAKEFGQRGSSKYYVLRVPYKNGTMEINIMSDDVCIGD